MNTSENVTNVTGVSPVGIGPRPHPVVGIAIPAIIFLVGLLGNTLTVVIMNRRLLRGSTTSIFFTALAVSDLVISINGPMMMVLHYLFGISLYKVFSCSLVMFCERFSAYCSSWFLVAITTERVLCVVYPHKVKLMCFPKRTIATIICICTVFCPIYLFFVLCFDTSYESVYIVPCGPSSDVCNWFFQDVLNWLSIFFIYIIPCMFIIPGNIIIIYKLKSSISMNTESKSITKSLVMVNIVFVITLSPLVIEEFINDWVYEYINVVLILNDFTYLNANLNFFLYVYNGKRYRAEFLKLFSCTRSPRTASVRSSEMTRMTSSSVIRRQSGVKHEG